MPPSKAPDAARRDAMNTAVRLLTQRRHTRRELAAKLGRRGVDADTAAAVIADCERLGYVDDGEAAALYIEELKAKGYGPRHVRFAMAKKGFDAALVDDGLARCYPPEDEADVAARVAVKKRDSLRGRKGGQDLRGKVYQYLYSRGFSGDAAAAALANAFGGGG